MSSFTDKLETVSIGDGWHEVAKEFRYHWKYKGSGLLVTIPVGRKTNFMTVPKWIQKIAVRFNLTWLYPRGIQDKATLVHDDGYTMKYLPRRVIDREFYKMCRICGCSRTRAGFYYINVRLFGWYYWYKSGVKV